MGQLSVNFTLKDSGDVTLARMDENLLSVDTAVVHDLSVSASGHHIKIWLAERRIGFERTYQRVGVEELEARIRADQPDMTSAIPKSLREQAARMDPADAEELMSIMRPPEPIADVGALYDHLASLTEWPDAACFALQQRDPVGTLLRWHVAKHRGTDGKAPLLDFVSCRLASGGRTVEMRNGRMESTTFCMANSWSFQGDRFSMG